MVACWVARAVDTTKEGVDAADAAVARAKQLGGQEVAPAFDVEGVGRMAVLTDPVGAAFNLMQNPPG